MNFAERALYHQIHPAKLFADIATALVAIDLFWRQALVPGLIIALLPPLLVSAVLMREADFERYRASPMGAYLRQFMPPWVQALRLFGVGVASYAAWHHFPAGVISGLALVAIDLPKSKDGRIVVDDRFRASGRDDVLVLGDAAYFG